MKRLLHSLVALLALPGPTPAYIDRPPTLGRLVPAKVIVLPHKRTVRRDESCGLKSLKIRSFLHFYACADPIPVTRDAKVSENPEFFACESWQL